MTTLEFNVEIEEETDSDVLKEVAIEIKSALAEEDAMGDPVAVPIEASRGLAEAAAVIAVAVPVVVNIDKGLDAVAGIIEKFKKLFANSDKKSESILAMLDASQILVNVDGILVPLNKLTEEHLKTLQSQ